MRHSARRYVARGGFLFVFLGVLWLILMTTSPASAQAVPETVGFGDFLAGLGAGGYLILLLGVGAALTTVMGAATVRRPDAWPHWRSLTHGLGEAAFLVGILSSLIGLRTGFMEITRLGAAVTPADLAGGLQMACGTPILATLAALVSLIGAGVIRLVEGRSA